MPTAKPIKTALVALDGSEVDQKLLSYCSYFGEILGIEKVFFLHVSKSLVLPDNLVAKYSEVLAPVDENLSHLFSERINTHFHNPKIERELIIAEGDTFEQILHQATIKSVDLIVMGRKNHWERQRILSERVVEQGPASLLLVPEQAMPEIHEILVPMDFSDRSLEALDLAQKISKLSQADYRCIHYYHSLVGSLGHGEAHREIRRELKEQSHQEWQTMLEVNDYDLKTPCEFFEDHGEAPEHCILRAEHLGADLIIMSSKGRTASAGVLLGSFAKELVRINRNTSMLVLKKKHENLDFFAALKALLN